METHKNFIKPTGNWWNITHCMMPTPEDLGDGIYRIYYAGRDKDNRSHIGYALIDLNDLSIIKYSHERVLSPGSLGNFDDNGVIPSCVYGDTFYYVGIKPGGTTRFQLHFGSVSKIGFQRTRDFPLMANSSGIATAPYVCNNLKYFVSGIKWIDKDTPSYNIRVDGHTEPAIDLMGDEIAVARPYVLKQNDLWRMWFCSKTLTETYKPQYAESLDGIKWERKPYDFPEEYLAYPIDIFHAGKEYMFYNKDKGQDGICLAVH